MTVLEITSKDQFDSLINSGKVIFVDFWAQWCGPCRAISPAFVKLAEQNAREGIEFYKVNIDDVPDISEAVGIRSIPTFHVYKNGVSIKQIVGANPGSLTTFVQANISA